MLSLFKPKRKPAETSAATETDEKLRKRSQLVHSFFMRALTKMQTLLRQGDRRCVGGMPLCVHWEITHSCNHRCSYCFQSRSGHQNVSCSLAQAETAIRHIAEANRPAYQVTLLGGEPLIYPHLKELTELLIENLGSRLEVLRIITNGARLPERAALLLDVARRTRLVIEVSVHFEFVNVEKLLAFIRDYSDRLDIELDVMLHPGHTNLMEETVRRLIQLRENHPFGMNIELLREPPTFTALLKDYTPTHFAWAEEARSAFATAAEASPKKSFTKREETGWNFFVEEGDDSGTELAFDNLDSSELQARTGLGFYGMHCIAGGNLLWIRPDGSVRGAICELVPSSCNIFEENPFGKETWIHAVPCILQKCYCSINHRLPKYKSAEEAGAFVAKCRNAQAALATAGRAGS